MVNPFKEMMLVFSDWKNSLKDDGRNILYSLIFLAISTTLIYLLLNLSGLYYFEISDKLLDIIKPMDWSYAFFICWSVPLALLFIFPLFFRPSEFSKLSFHLGLVTLFGGLFTLLLPIKSYSDAIPIASQSLPFLSLFPNHIFFSGLVAIPLVGFWVFKDSKIRWFFFISAIAMATIALCMHQIYSIEVLFAFFLSHSSFVFGEWLVFKYENFGKKKEFNNENLY